jgi:hypothetical protein
MRSGCPRPVLGTDDPPPSVAERSDCAFVGMIDHLLHGTMNSAASGLGRQTQGKLCDRIVRFLPMNILGMVDPFICDNGSRFEPAVTGNGLSSPVLRYVTWARQPYILWILHPSHGARDFAGLPLPASGSWLDEPRSSAASRRCRVGTTSFKHSPPHTRQKISVLADDRLLAEFRCMHARTAHRPQATWAMDPWRSCPLNRLIDIGTSGLPPSGGASKRARLARLLPLCSFRTRDRCRFYPLE